MLVESITNHLKKNCHAKDNFLEIDLDISCTKESLELVMKYFYTGKLNVADLSLSDLIDLLNLLRFLDLKVFFTFLDLKH